MTLAEVHNQVEANPVITLARHTGRPTEVLLRLPDYMRPGLVRFILFGIRPGSFLCAVLADEAEIARNRADSTNAGLIERYRDFLEFEAPDDCWGSSDKVRAWCERGGLIGKAAA